MKNYFQPTRDADYSQWLENLASKAPIYQDILNISVDDVARLHDSSVMFKYTLDWIEKEKSYGQSVVNYKDALRKGAKNSTASAFPTFPTAGTVPTAVEPNIADFVSKLVRAIKGHANYTEAIGLDLGIIGSEKAGLDSSVKPILKITLNAGKPVIGFKKMAATGLDIYVSRDGETSFGFLATTLLPKYEDEFPVNASSERWAYKAIYRKKNKQVGQFSDVATVVVGKF